MKIVLILYLLVMFRNGATAAEAMSSFTSTFVNDIASLNFYQITLFINNLNVSLIECNILKEIFVHNPAIIIDPRRLQAHSSGYLEYLTNSYQPSASILLIVFLKNLYPDEIKFALNFYIQLSQKRRRPKCLVIFNDRFVEENIIRLVLKFSWQRKFLDISIINLNTDNTTVNPEVFSYDPFVDIYNHRQHWLISDVFPDKFKNLHGYILKSPFIDVPPYMMIETVNNITRYYGVGYSLIEFLASVLQFKMNVTAKSYLVEATIQLSNFNSIHLLPMPCMVLESTTRKSLEIGQVFTFERFCGLITIKKDIHIKLSLKTFLSFSCSISLVFLFVFIAKYFFKLKYLYWFENFGLLLGQPVTVQLLSTIHKIMYVSVVALSMTYAPNLIGQLMNSIITYSDKNIVSYQDVVTANLQPYVYKGLFALLYNESDKYFDIIKSKTILLNDSSSCFSLLRDGKDDAICFTTKRIAKWFLNENVKMYGNPLAEITNIEFPLLAEALLFEEGSPFVDKFNTIILRMKQSLLTAAWSFKYETKLINNRKLWNEVKNEINPVQLIIMYFIGCCASFIVFAVEVLITYCKVSQNQRLKQIKISKVK